MSDHLPESRPALGVTPGPAHRRSAAGGTGPLLPGPEQSSTRGARPRPRQKRTFVSWRDFAAEGDADYGVGAVQRP
jgi:hypothetical protein